ncbi:hypothetical protein QUH73_10795 [Labilibaculum sp. K2S]|uniref:hypothetical protein n=1 Tax=Labilibaculum sp. K2S TaxID=3056386 RepID=UPI0025A4B097|nr:hypothetical protein [Labilibaculum sp. K2S]MDM8160302.1 hypothetical protein [Labilibaculum sp. K2S]
MRKLIFAFLFLSFVFAACDNGSDKSLDDLKKENQELKDALAASSKITNVEFTASEMILTYSNGLKLTTAIPDVLRGEDGTTPKIGENGNWWIGTTDTGVLAQGQNGTNGADGTDGSNGTNGVDGNSPIIGENGNWWIGDTDTNVAATGAAGVAGVGIQSISFDQSTGVMTITLTNGTESKFVIDNKDGSLAAYIMEDLNGKYLVKKITMGDIPYAEFEYNDDHQITKLTSYSANGYQTFKRFEVEKEYVDGKPSKVLTRRFATEKTTKYSDEYVGSNGYDVIEVDEDKGDRFMEENSDGIFFVYFKNGPTENGFGYNKYFASKGSRLYSEISFNAGGKTCTVYDYESTVSIANSENVNIDYYYYRVYEKALIFSDYENSYYKSIKRADNQFEIYEHRGSRYFYRSGSGNIDDLEFYVLNSVRTIQGTYEIGELMSETYSDLVYDSSNKVEKIYESREEGVEATSYILNSYDGDNLAKTERFSKDGDNWMKEAKYSTYQYNSQNLLTQAIEHDAEGNEKVISKIEYDQEGNPIEIFKYYSEQVDRYGIVNPETGIREYQDVVVAESGLYSFAKLEYNYTMKNFFGNTITGLFPELYGFNFINALKSGTFSNSINAGAIEYKNFNDGGYPQIMEFIGSGDDDSSFIGQLKIEYIKIED